MTYFIGLGPRGDTINEEELKDFLNSTEELGQIVAAIRTRGTCAFATLVDGANGDLFQQTFNGRTLKDCRFSVQLSKQSGGGQRNLENGGLTVFVGLGPNADSVSDAQLKLALEEAGKLSTEIRRRGQCAFVDFETRQDADRAVETLHGTMLGECRLSVQMSRRNAQSNRNDRNGGHRNGGGRDDGDRKRRDRSRSRRRSHSRRDRSRDRRRRRSDSEESRDRRRRRDDSRDDRRRDRRDERRDDRRDERRQQSP